MKSKLIFLFSLFLFACSPKPKNPGEGIHYFSGTFEQAVETATKENKNIFIYGHTDWCGYCRKMEKSTLKEKEVNDYLNKKFINLNYDLEKGEGMYIASKFNINSYPTCLILNSSGELLAFGRGYMNTERFMSWVKSNP